jgi:hypothetical protein
LATCIRARGAGKALIAASRYLSASGIHVHPTLSGQGSFPTCEVSDSPARATVDFVLAAPPYASADIPGVLIGTREGRCGVLFWSRRACGTCVVDTLGEFTGTTADDVSALAGALGAWFLQRLCLDEAIPPWAGQWVEPSGVLSAMSLPTCRHRR